MVWRGLVRGHGGVSLVIEDFPDLGITRISRWCFNCYLLAEDLAPLLADRPGQLRAVTATHGHPDHIGGAATLAQRHGAEIYLPATTMTYLDGATPRTPSVAKLARTWPLLFGQPFDIKAAVGFVRATSSAGFGTSRGMLWRGPRPAGGLEDGASLPAANRLDHCEQSGPYRRLRHPVARRLAHAAVRRRGDRDPRFAPDTVDDAAAAKTTARLRSLPVEHLLPGHGRPLHGNPVWHHAR
jgi:Metallo-beta-lactamase superfamily